MFQKGDNIKRYREESGAKINISDGSCPERIVTITGTTDNIHKAFTMICQKFEEVRDPSMYMYQKDNDGEGWGLEVSVVGISCSLCRDYSD